MKSTTDINPTKSAIKKKRAELAANGINLRELCDSNGISYQSARDLLCGRSFGRRGNSHLAAVFLGLKPKPKKMMKRGSAA